MVPYNTSTSTIPYPIIIISTYKAEGKIFDGTGRRRRGGRTCHEVFDSNWPGDGHCVTPQQRFRRFCLLWWRTFQSQPTMVSCCSRFHKELNPCQDWFWLQDEGEGQIVDVQASFCPRSVGAIVLKLVAVAFISFVFAYTFFDTEHRDIHFGYLTYWALSLTLLYGWTSLFNSIRGAKQPRRPSEVLFRIGLQWYLFHLALHTDLLVVLLYWTVDFERGETTLTFNGVAAHAGTCLAVLLEGFAVNRIPVRWYFWWGTSIPIGLAYLGWTLIHWQAEIGNSAKNDSDLLYEAVDWEDDPRGTIVLFVVSIFVVGPILQTLMFVISIYGWPCCCGRNIRRYADENIDDDLEKPEESSRGYGEPTV